MASSQNNAYLLPDNHVPDTFRCLKVWIPSDDLYLWQFLTAYSFFGKWIAWERDELKRGKEAAAVWREAIEMTRNSLADGCADCISDEDMTDILEKLDDILERLQELENMNITVTQNACGCGCGTTQTTQTDGVIIPDDFDGSPPILDDTPVVGTQSQTCRAANYLADKIIAAARGIGSLGAAGTIIALIVSGIATILTWLSPVPGDEPVPTSIFVLIAWQIVAALNTLDDFDLDLFDNLADELESSKQQFVCDLYGNYTDAYTVGGYVSNWINNQVDALADELSLEDATRERIKDIINNVISNYVINWFVERTASIVPDDYVAPLPCDCGGGGSNSDDFVPFVVDAVTDEYNGSDGWSINHQLPDLSHDYAFRPDNVDVGGTNVCGAYNWCVGVHGTYNNNVTDYFIAFLGDVEGRTASGLTGFTVNRDSKISFLGALWLDTSPKELRVQIRDGATDNLLHEEVFTGAVPYRSTPPEIVVNYTLTVGNSYRLIIYNPAHAVGDIKLIDV